MADRYFTPAEANELLSTVRPLVQRMVSHRRALAVATVRHARIATKIAGNGGGVRPHEVDELQTRIDDEAAQVVRCVAELQELGLLVKDLDEGLVDFPALSGDARRQAREARCKCRVRDRISALCRSAPHRAVRETRSWN